MMRQFRPGFWLDTAQVFGVSYFEHQVNVWCSGSVGSSAMCVDYHCPSQTSDEAIALADEIATEVIRDREQRIAEFVHSSLRNEAWNPPPRCESLMRVPITDAGKSLDDCKERGGP